MAVITADIERFTTRAGKVNKIKSRVLPAPNAT
jgi:hypothetical protein